MYPCGGLSMWMWVSGSSEKDIGFLGAIVPGSCEPPEMDAGSETWSSAREYKLLNAKPFPHEKHF